MKHEQQNVVPKLSCTETLTSRIQILDNTEDEDSPVLVGMQHNGWTVDESKPILENAFYGREARFEIKNIKNTLQISLLLKNTMFFVPCNFIKIVKKTQ